MDDITVSNRNKVSFDSTLFTDISIPFKINGKDAMNKSRFSKVNLRVFYR